MCIIRVTCLFAFVFCFFCVLFSHTQNVTQLARKSVSVTSNKIRFQITVSIYVNYTFSWASCCVLQTYYTCVMLVMKTVRTICVCLPQMAPEGMQ